MSRRGRVYTPAATHNAEQVIAAGWTGPKFAGPVSVDVIFSKAGTTVTVESLDPLVYGNSVLRGDVDNMAKLVLDALNGVAYLDDKQVCKLLACKL